MFLLQAKTPGLHVAALIRFVSFIESRFLRVYNNQAMKIWWNTLVVEIVIDRPQGTVWILLDFVWVRQ